MHQPPDQPALTEGLSAPKQLSQKQCRATGVAAKGPEGDLQEITQDASVISKWEGTGEQRAWEGDRLKRGGKSSRRDGRSEYLFRPLLLFHAIANHDVDSFSAESLHYPLKAALLPCTHGRRKERRHLVRTQD